MFKRIKTIIKKPPMSYIFAACVAISFYMILTNLSPLKEGFHSVAKLFSPVVTGLIIAYLFNPAVMFFKNKVFKKMKDDSVKDTAAIILTLICLILAVVIMLVALIPSIAKSVTTIISNWDTYIEKLHEYIDKFAVIAKEKNWNIDFAVINDYATNWADKLFDIVKDNSKVIIGIVGDVGTSIGNFLMGVLFGFCFLFSKKHLVHFVNMIRGAIYEPEKLNRHNEILGHCNEVFIKYVGSTLLDAFIVGIATLIFGLIMKLPFTPLIALISAITNIIPTFGPMIGTTVGAIFLVLENPWGALFLIVFECILQSIDGMIIKPRLFKGSLGLPASWTMILIFLGGKLAGMTGIILSIPFGAIFVILWKETVEPFLAHKKEMYIVKEVKNEETVETEKTEE